MSVVQQCALMRASAGSTDGLVQTRCQALRLGVVIYYRPCGESAQNLVLMCLLDEEFT